MRREHTQHKNMISRVCKQYELEERKKSYVKEILTHFFILFPGRCDEAVNSIR